LQPQKQPEADLVGLRRIAAGGVAGHRSMIAPIRYCTAKAVVKVMKLSAVLARPAMPTPK
jgi:hypothetical protein